MINQKTKKPNLTKEQKKELVDMARTFRKIAKTSLNLCEDMLQDYKYRNLKLILALLWGMIGGSLMTLAILGY